VLIVGDKSGVQLL